MGKDPIAGGRIQIMTSTITIQTDRQTDRHTFKKFKNMLEVGGNVTLK